MKHALALPLALLSTPALAHPGAHPHPHLASPAAMILALVALTAAALLAYKVRR